MKKEGGLSFSSETTKWEAVGLMPKVMLGDKWLESNADLSKPSPVVDVVKEATGNLCTIFQRSGDTMVRVCTNVVNGDKRAIGTTLTADKSLAVQSVLKGRV